MDKRLYRLIESRLILRVLEDYNAIQESPAEEMIFSSDTFDRAVVRNNSEAIIPTLLDDDI